MSVFRIATLLIIALAVSAPAALDWEEATLASGGRIIAVGGGSGGWASLALAFPAGAASTGERPRLARLAPSLFAGPGWDESGELESSLRSLGWVMQERVDADLALLLLNGPSGEMSTVLEHFLSRLDGTAEFSREQFDAALGALSLREQNWAANPEVVLRQEMAALHFGEHPYAVAATLLPEGEAPGIDEMRVFMDAHYSPGAMLLVAAGDLETEPFMDRWLPAFDRLGGLAPALPSLSVPTTVSGRVESGCEAGRELLLLQIPGEKPGTVRSARLALVAGVLHQLLVKDVQGRGLALSASAWYDFTANGPRPLEIQIRRFDGEKLPGIEATLSRIFERLREGEFSQYQVITAKDRILQRIGRHSRAGEGPPRTGSGDLTAWTAELARQAMFTRDSRDRFRNAVMQGSVESIRDYAREVLREEQGTLGLLFPGAGID